MSKTYKPTAQFVDMDAEEAKKLLGFRTALKEGEKGLSYRDGTNKQAKFVMDNNKSNRPFSMGLAKTYGEQIFNGDFAGQWNHPAETTNGEPWIFDADGNVVSCAHRGVGLILAQAKRDLLAHMGQTELLDEYAVPEKITMPILLVLGVDPEAADTVDTAKMRALGDVLFRRHTFKNGKDISESVKVKLSRELAHAIRLVWLRLHGEMVKGGGKFAFPEALKFLESHPRLVDCLEHVYNEDNSGEQTVMKKKISNYISLGYAAAMMYLAGYSGTDRAELEAGTLDMNKEPKQWSKAEKFWTLFAQLTGQTIAADKAPAVSALNLTLAKNYKSDKKYERDALCVLVTRAWTGFAEDETKYQTPKDLVKDLYKKAKGEDRETLQFVRFGGFDIDKEVLIENGWLRAEQKLERLSIGQWKVGDTAWVYEGNPKVGPWFGQIVSFDPNKDACVVESKEEGDIDEGGKPNQYGVSNLAHLFTEKPKVEVPEEKKTDAPKAPGKKLPPARKLPPVAAK